MGVNFNNVTIGKIQVNTTPVGPVAGKNLLIEYDASQLTQPPSQGWDVYVTQPITRYFITEESTTGFFMTDNGVSREGYVYYDTFTKNTLFEFEIRAEDLNTQTVGVTGQDSQSGLSLNGSNNLAFFFSGTNRIFVPNPTTFTKYYLRYNTSKGAWEAYNENEYLGDSVSKPQPTFGMFMNYTSSGTTASTAMSISYFKIYEDSIVN